MNIIKKKKVKIVHLIQHMKIGGAQKALINIIKTTSEFYQHVIVSTLNQYEFELKELQVSFIDLSKKNIIKVLMDEKPNIIHYHWWPGFKMIEKKRLPLKCKLIVTIQDPTPVEDIQADIYISGGHFIDDLQQHISNNNRTIIKSFIDVQEFSLPRNTTENIIIGRHSTIYNNKIPSNYIKNLLEFNLDATFIIAGDGDQELIRKLSYEIAFHQAEEKIKLWPGHKIKEMLSICDIFLYLTPSNSVEGFANVISEAMVAGIPIIAERKGGNSEQIVHGVTGYLCDDYKQARDFCKELIQDHELRLEMAENSKKRGLTFDFNIMGNLYREVYNNLLKEYDYSR